MNSEFFKKYLKHGIVIIGIFLTIGIFTGCGQNQLYSGEKQKFISVSGQGSASALPDVAHVNLGVDFAGSNLSTVLDKANNSLAQITQVANDMGIDKKDIQTANFSVWIEDSRDLQNQLTGTRIYHVTSSQRVTIRDIDTAGEMIGAAVDAGANSVSNLNFGIDDTSALESKARALALADARVKAQEIATELGVKLGNPISVTESPGNTPSLIPRMEKAAYDQSFLASGVSVNQGEFSVNVQIYVAFELLP